MDVFFIFIIYFHFSADWFVPHPSDRSVNLTWIRYGIKSQSRNYTSRNALFFHGDWKACISLGKKKRNGWCAAREDERVVARMDERKDSFRKSDQPQLTRRKHRKQIFVFYGALFIANAAPHSHSFRLIAHFPIRPWNHPLFASKRRISGRHVHRRGIGSPKRNLASRPTQVDQPVRPLYRTIRETGSTLHPLSSMQFNRPYKGSVRTRAPICTGLRDFYNILFERLPASLETKKHSRMIETT